MSKNSKLRDCPALGLGIPVPDCGARRHSAIPCAADCPHNPFSLASDNYTRSLEIEDRLNALTVAKLVDETPGKAAHFSQLDAAIRSGPHGENAFMTWRIFFEEDAAQTTFAQRWQQAGWPGLKNDEITFMRAKIQMRVALIEIHRLLPEGLTECVDLLSANPAPMLFRENAIARRMVRFSTVLAWIYPMPHYWRMSGTAIDIPDIALLSAAGIVREIALHLGASRDDAPMRRWLANNFQRVEDSLDATRHARHIQMLDSIDAKWGRAVYELQNTPAHCLQRLDALRDVEPDDLNTEESQEGFTDARVCFDSQPPRDAPADSYSIAVGANVVLGRVLLGTKHWRLEAMGAERLARLRARFEEHMGARVRFVSERVDDLGKREALKIPDADKSLIPPRLLENPAQIHMASSRVALPPGNMPRHEYEQQLRDASDRAFLNDKIPALENRTPREAAAAPALRPTLVQLMKHRVREHDLRNLKNETDHDINWMLTELGLTEILFDAPPRRPIPKDMLADDDDDEDDDDYENENENNSADENDSEKEKKNAGKEKSGAGAAAVASPETRPPAPRLTGAPLSMEEVMERLDKLMDDVNSFSDYEDEVRASGSTILDDADEILDDLLDVPAFGIQAIFLMQAWLVLVPRGCRAPRLDRATLKAVFHSNMREFSTMDMLADADSVLEAMTSGPQSGLMKVLVAQILFASRDGADEKMRLNVSEATIIIALLKAVVTCLDETLRRP